MVGILGAIGAGALGGAGITIVIRAVDRFSTVFTKASLSSKALGASLRIGASAMLAVGAAAAIVGVTSVKAFAKVETEFAKVNTLLDEGIDAQKTFGEFVKKTNVAMGNQGDQLDVLAGLYQTISAGITDTAEAQEFMTFAVRTAVGGTAQLSSVILAGTKSIAAFGLEVEDTERVFDLFAGTVKAGQTTMEQLASAFPTVAGLAGQAGISIEETLGTFAGLTKILGGTDETATSLAATIRGFIKPSKDMEEAVSSLGFESASALVKEVGLNKALQMLNESVDGDTEALAKLFPNVRALKAVFPLLGLAAEDVADSINIVTNSTGLAQKQFEDMAQTAEFRLGQSMSELKNVLIDIGGRILPVIVPAFAQLASIFASDILPALEPLIPILVDGLIGALELIAPLLPSLIGGFGQLIAKFVEFFIALEPLIEPLSGILDDIINIGVNLSGIFLDGLNSVIPALGDLLDILGPLIELLRVFVELMGKASRFGALSGIGAIQPGTIGLNFAPSGFRTAPITGGLGAGTGNTTVNIENVNGLDAENVSDALQFRLRNLINI